VICIPKLSC